MQDGVLGSVGGTARHLRRAWFRASDFWRSTEDVSSTDKLQEAILKAEKETSPSSCW